MAERTWNLRAQLDALQSDPICEGLQTADRAAEAGVPVVAVPGRPTVAAADPDPNPDPLTLRWFYETGEEAELIGGQSVVYRYRTIFALDPSWLDDRWPMADLAEEADDSVGRLMAAASSFYQAVLGPDPANPRHRQLKRLLAGIRAHRDVCASFNNAPDSSALWEALEECEGMLADLETALTRATEAPHA